MISCITSAQQSCNATVQETFRNRWDAPAAQNQAGVSNQIEAGASAAHLEVGESTSDLRVLAHRGLVTLAFAMQTMGTVNLQVWLVANLTTRLGCTAINPQKSMTAMSSSSLQPACALPDPVGVRGSCQAYAFHGRRS